jgi:dolichol-phosphate mannosyltransferase
MHAIVVIPTYNEHENLEPLVQQILQHTNGLHILIVDDNSPDGTGKVAEALSEKNSSTVFVLHRRQKEGLGPAYVDAFRHVLDKGYEVILQMDADLSHDPSYLPMFLERIRSSDLVIGSRYMHGLSVVNWDFKRLMLSKLATKYIQFVTRMPFSDATGGFNCWRRQTLEAIGFDDVFSNGYLFLAELKYKAYRKNFKVIEIPIVFTERNLGRSKLNWHIIWEAIWGVLKLRRKY